MSILSLSQVCCDSKNEEDNITFNIRPQGMRKLSDVPLNLSEVDTIKERFRKVRRGMVSAGESGDGA